MITWLIWTVWTSLSAVPRKAVKFNHSLIWHLWGRAIFLNILVHRILRNMVSILGPCRFRDLAFGQTIILDRYFIWILRRVFGHTVNPMRQVAGDLAMNRARASTTTVQLSWDIRVSAKEGSNYFWRNRYSPTDDLSLFLRIEAKISHNCVTCTVIRLPKVKCKPNFCYIKTCSLPC